MNPPAQAAAVSRAGESPVCAFLRNPTMVDFAGHFSLVCFVSGCNFRCGFCHNAGLLARAREGIPWNRLDASCRGYLDQWVDAAVITGGEPTLRPDLPDLIRLFRDLGWAVKLDTNGSNPARLAECLPLLDYVALDVKAGFSAYERVTGCAAADSVRESMTLLRAGARDYEFRTTIVDTIHTDEQMEEIRTLIAGARRYVLQPFVPRPDLPDPALAALPRTSPARLREIRDRLRGAAADVLIRGD